MCGGSLAKESHHTVKGRDKMQETTCQSNELPQSGAEVEYCVYVNQC